jgi:hypothetical protein
MCTTIDVPCRLSTVIFRPWFGTFTPYRRPTDGSSTVGVRFHPDERFWDFQLIESGLALVVSAGVLGLGL